MCGIGKMFSGRKLAEYSLEAMNPLKMHIHLWHEFCCTRNDLKFVYSAKPQSGRIMCATNKLNS